MHLADVTSLPQNSRPLKNEAELRKTIRQKIASSDLPARHPRLTWAGPPTGQTCSVCEERIAEGDREIEAEGADERQRFYHLSCFTVLEDERRQLGG